MNFARTTALTLLFIAGTTCIAQSQAQRRRISRGYAAPQRVTIGTPIARSRYNPENVSRSAATVPDGYIALENRAAFSAFAYVSWEEPHPQGGWDRKTYNWENKPALKKNVVRIPGNARSIRIHFRHNTGVNQIQTRKDYFSTTAPRIECTFYGTTLIGYKVEIKNESR